MGTEREATAMVEARIALAKPGPLGTGEFRRDGAGREAARRTAVGVARDRTVA